MKKQLFSFILLLVTSVLLAGDPDSAEIKFHQANDLYRSGDYSGASKKYNELISEGYASFELFYNAGNAFYKLNEIPAAILNYERAARLSPGDEDLQHNLKLANLKTPDRAEPMPEAGISVVFRQITGGLSDSNWALLSIFALVAGLMGICFYLRLRKIALKKISFYSGITTIAISLLFLVFASVQNNRLYSGKSAVIFSPSVTAYSSPDAKSTVLFVIHEGMKVKVLEEESTFTKIRIKNGNIGWISRTTYQKI